MKIPSARSPKGFTLIELLVVITIIAVLAGVAAPVTIAQIQRGKKVAALTTATVLQTAVNNFFTEYGSMPDDGTATADTPVGSPIKTNSSAGVDLLKVLLGINTTINTRGVNFLQVQQGKETATGGTDGLVYEKDGATVRGLYDPWGGPFCLVLDLDYDEKLVDVKTAADKEANKKTLNGRRVAVWSNGADGKNGGGKPADDVKTWGN